MSTEAYYHYPAEVWDVATCRKVARRTAKDGCGTPYPFKGYIYGTGGTVSGYGTTRYNGGTVIDGQWYQGIVRPLPVVAPGYTIVDVPTWGKRLIRTKS